MTLLAIFLNQKNEVILGRCINNQPYGVFENRPENVQKDCYQLQYMPSEKRYSVVTKIVHRMKQTAVRYAYSSSICHYY